MHVDPAKLTASLQTETKRRDDLAYKRTGKVTDTFFNRIMLNENDGVSAVIEVLLGITPGGREKVAELLGFTAETPGEPAALTAPNKGLLPALNADGSATGTGFGTSPDERDRAHKAGFTERLGTDGSIDAWIPLANATATPVPPAPADKTVDVKDKNGAVNRQVLVSVGRNDDTLEAILAADGSVDYFRVKPRWARR